MRKQVTRKGAGWDQSIKCQKEPQTLLFLCPPLQMCLLQAQGVLDIWDTSTRTPTLGEITLQHCFILKGEISSLRRLRAIPGG